MNNRSLTQKVKDKAHQLGFSLVGVAPADPSQSIERYKDWLANGHHASMDYLSGAEKISKRAQPKQILPDCQSILVLAIPYDKPVPIEAQSQDAPTGRIAAYAYGQDYHDVLLPKLKEIVAFIERESGQPLSSRSYTDTGPLLERELALRAGLGWIGKNSMLINPRQGSYFLLAEILLSIPLEPDQAFPSDHCGNCTRCIDACPTDCILPNRTLDAGRCISYLTIELKEEVPIELRDEMQNWVFGCDVCQEVCPWNIRFAPQTGDPAFAPSKIDPHPELEPELSLSQPDFSTKFKGSPLKRSKRRGYLRNVSLALGNAGQAASLPALNQILREEAQPLVRAHAAWAMGQIGGSLAQKELRLALKSESQMEVKEEIQLALAKLN